MEPIIQVQGLTKRYGHINALHDVNVSLAANQIYGLLGRNGAGKTTLMRIMSGQLYPSAGRVQLFQQSPVENNTVLRQLCFIQDSQVYPDTYRVQDVLAVARAAFPRWDNDYAQSLVQQFQLPLKRRIKQLSRGMRSAVGIVVGLASRAPLTMFDEPYLGLDAVARTIFYDLLLEDYGRHPRTIVLSSHLIDEISALLNHVIVIDKGHIMLDESADALRSRAFTVVGSQAAVEQFVAGKPVIHRQGLGGLATATVMARWNGALCTEATSHGLEFTPVPLQQLVVHLTRQTSQEVDAQ